MDIYLNLNIENPVDALNQISSLKKGMTMSRKIFQEQYPEEKFPESFPEIVLTKVQNEILKVMEIETNESKINKTD